MAAIDDFSYLFDPYELEIRGVKHQIIGRTTTETDVVGNETELSELIQNLVGDTIDLSMTLGLDASGMPKGHGRPFDDVPAPDTAGSVLAKKVVDYCALYGYQISLPAVTSNLASITPMIQASSATVFELAKARRSHDNAEDPIVAAYIDLARSAGTILSTDMVNSCSTYHLDGEIGELCSAIANTVGDSNWDEIPDFKPPYADRQLTRT